MKRYQVTQEDYIRAGAYCRMCHYILCQLWCAPAVPRDAQNIAHTANKKLDQVRGRTEDKMFSDFPHIRGGLDVFYGEPSNKPTSQADAETVEMMNKIVREMLGDNFKE